MVERNAIPPVNDLGSVVQISKLAGKTDAVDGLTQSAKFGTLNKPPTATNSSFTLKNQQLDSLNLTRPAGVREPPDS